LGFAKVLEDSRGIVCSTEKSDTEERHDRVYAALCKARAGRQALQVVHLLVGRPLRVGGVLIRVVAELAEVVVEIIKRIALAGGGGGGGVTIP
jgi:hypothetical protein